MAERKSFLLRIDPSVLDAVQRWANDDLRSINAHIEFLLRDALRRAGRPSRDPAAGPAAADPADAGPELATPPVEDQSEGRS